MVLTNEGLLVLTPEQLNEIESCRSRSAVTRRTTVQSLEELLYQPLPVLDHGFVRVVDYMGDDAAIVQAARVSFGIGTKRRRDDAGLLRYLMRNRHTSPFEMCEIKLHVRLPIFVARQWIRHRTASVNEYSARYSILDREFYIPATEHIATQPSSQKQGRGRPLDESAAKVVQQLLRDDAERSYDHYLAMLGGSAESDRQSADQGLARELARINLSLNFYTQWYWKIDLHNLLHFLRLRADPHAQYEIRAYAEVIALVVQKWVPLTYDAFVDYEVGGGSISAKGLEALRRMLRGEQLNAVESGMSEAEWREFNELIAGEEQE